MGAAGRDFHNFNMVFRHDERYEVVAFTAAQIPGIACRLYPPPLAGPLYPDGIMIYPEAELAKLIKKHQADEVVFSYSDINYADVMHIASRVIANGADFRLLGSKGTMLKAHIPVVSVCAVRTGAGKSQMTRAICVMLRELGLRVAAIRHPIPYGDLVRQRAQRFATLADMDEAQCTIEEREEYEPLIESGSVVFAGVDYADILKTAEAEADVIVWEGGNNDLPFIVSNYHIVIADALRPGHEMLYHPGEANARMADVIIINKVDSAAEGAVETIRENLAKLNSRALILEAFSPVLLDDAASAKGKRALVIEDGPTVTHGGMPFGAGTIAARNAGAVPVDPRPFAVGSIRRAFEQYPHLGKVLPALGYSNEQVAELQETVNQADCDIVISGTPIDITRVIKVGKPVLRARYELQQVSGPKLKDLLDENIVPLACSCEGEACRIK